MRAGALRQQCDAADDDGGQDGRRVEPAEGEAPAVKRLVEQAAAMHQGFTKDLEKAWSTRNLPPFHFLFPDQVGAGYEEDHHDGAGCRISFFKQLSICSGSGRQRWRHK
jgi:hypothetical protein